MCFSLSVLGASTRFCHYAGILRCMRYKNKVFERGTRIFLLSIPTVVQEKYIANYLKSVFCDQVASHAGTMLQLEQHSAAYLCFFSDNSPIILVVMFPYAQGSQDSYCQQTEGRREEISV